MMRAALVIPTYNEASNLPLLIEEIESTIDRSWLDLQYIVVDDNSPDGTGAVADGLAQKYSMHVIHRAGKQGLGSAVRAGFAATDRPFLAVMDADLSHDPALLPKLFKDLDTVDIAIGSRFAEGSSVENWQLGRKLLSQTGVALARRLTGVKDPLSGFFAFRRTVIDGVNLTTVGYKILLEILVKGTYHEFNERPFEFRMRRFSTSKLNFTEYWFFAKQLVEYGVKKIRRSAQEQWPVLAVFAAVAVATLAVAATQSIWLDEGLSREFVQRSASSIVYLAQTTDLHPPLYYLFLHFIGPAVDFGIIALRSLSAVWYGLFLWVVYTRAIRPHVVGVWRRAASLLAIAMVPFGLFYASELRSYMATVLVCALQFFAFIDLLQREPVSQRAAQWRYGLYSLLSLWLFYPCAFILVGQFLYIVARQRAAWRRCFWPWLVITIAYSPWLFSVVLKRAGEQPGHFLAIPWWQIPVIIAAGFGGGRVAVTDLNHLHQYWPTALSLLVFVVGLVGLWYWWRTDRRNQAMEILWWQILTSVVICLVISATRFSIFDPRYYTPLYPLYIIMVIYSLGYLWRNHARLAVAVVGVSVACSLVINSLYWFNPWYQREPWKTVVPQVEAELLPTDTVMFIGKFQPPPTYAAYQTKQTKVIGVYPDDLADVSQTEVIEAHVRQSLQGVDRVWYSQFLEWQKDPQGLYRKILEAEGFKYQRTIGFFKVKFDLYGRH